MQTQAEISLNQAIAQIPTSFEVAGSNIVDQAIATLREELTPLVIDGVKDKTGYESVRLGIGKVRGYRVKIEERRKELKAPALEYGKAVDAEAKRITSELSEIEDGLSDKKKVIDDEKERVKLEEQERLDAIRQAEILRQKEEAEAKAKEEAEARAAAEAENRLMREKIDAMLRDAEEQRLAQEALLKAAEEARLQAEEAVRQEQARVLRTIEEEDRQQREDKEAELRTIREEYLSPDREIMRDVADSIIELAFCEYEINNDEASEFFHAELGKILDICGLIKTW